MPTPGRPRYRKPPVVEAVLEFQFQPSARPWDSLYFGKIHDRMLRVVDLPRIQPIQAASFIVGQQGVGFTQRGEIKRFASKEGGLAVTLGPGLLGTSILPSKHPGGHPGWDRLRDTAFRLLPAYLEV